jgi:hypothetical protein
MLNKENPAAMGNADGAPNAIQDGGKRSENRKAKRGAQHDGLVHAKRFLLATLRTIEQANAIIAEYAENGLTLTLRQLHYQFVARGFYANTQGNYKRLSSILSDARREGLVDWDAIEDRTRELETFPHWGSPSEILESCANHFHLDRWETQPTRLEVWTEKRALIELVARACSKRRVPYFACVGFTSASALRQTAVRFDQYINDGQSVLILHVGDHDPSGIDMTRDNTKRIREHLGDLAAAFELRRIGLNIEQVRERNLPPNPIKKADPRWRSYAKDFGSDCWELDALDPADLFSLIKSHIEREIDEAAYDEMLEREHEARDRLAQLAYHERGAQP